MVNILLNYYNFDEEWAYPHLKNYLHAGQKVAVIPLAFREYEVYNDHTWQNMYGMTGEKFNRILAPLLKYGICICDIMFVDFFDFTKEMHNFVETADVLLLCGGMPDKIPDRLRKLRLLEPIKNYKGIIIGVSAGAMVQFDSYHITPDEDYDSYVQAVGGLGLIDGFDLEVHFEDTEVQQKSILKALSENNKPIFAMKHQGGLIVDNGKIIAIGDVSLHGEPPKHYELVFNKKAE